MQVVVLVIDAAACAMGPQFTVPVQVSTPALMALAYSWLPAWLRCTHPQHTAQRCFRSNNLSIPQAKAVC